MVPSLNWTMPAVPSKPPSDKVRVFPEPMLFVLLAVARSVLIDRLPIGAMGLAAMSKVAGMSPARMVIDLILNLERCDQSRFHLNAFVLVPRARNIPRKMP